VHFKAIDEVKEERKTEGRKTRSAVLTATTTKYAARNRTKNDAVDQLYMTPKELKQFQLALKNSLLETENVNASIT